MKQKKSNKHKKYLRRTAAALACASLFAFSALFCSCSNDSGIELPSDISIDSGEPGTRAPADSRPGGETEKETKPAEENYTYKTDISAYLKYIEPSGTKKNYLELVNKTHTVNKSYGPEKTVSLESDITLYGKEVLLEEYTAMAAKAMIAEMRACGFKNIYVTSGYRSYEKQSSLYYTYLANEKKAHPDWTDEQAAAKVLTYSAYPGTSEHQSGLCMDLFVSPGMTELVNYGSETTAKNDIGFAESDEYKWLVENAHKFGFILRFGKDKEDITGYSYESWHYRFVGRSEATRIYNAGKCLEEYLDSTGSLGN